MERPDCVVGSAMGEWCGKGSPPGRRNSTKSRGQKLVIKLRELVGGVTKAARRRRDGGIDCGWEEVVYGGPGDGAIGKSAPPRGMALRHHPSIGSPLATFRGGAR